MSFDPVSSTSTQYIPVDVKRIQAGAATDPTGDTVKMAFLAPDALPQNSDWLAAAWETNTLTTPDTYTAVCLVGPSGLISLTSGSKYSVWVKVTDNPERPEIKVPGLLAVL